MVQSISRPYFDPVLSGKKMRSIRKSRNISVEQVREYMGFESVQSIYKWERGECFPQADTLIALSMLYRVNPVELFEEDAEASSFHLFMKLYRSTVRPVSLCYNAFSYITSVAPSAGCLHRPPAPF